LRALARKWCSYVAILQRESPSQSPDDAAGTAPQGTYAELKRLVKEHGLLERAPLRYFLRTAAVYVLFALSIALFIMVHVFWFQLLNAVLLAFVSTQFGFIGHDAGHRQVFTSTRKNDVLGLIQGNLLLGMSFYWWLDKHNQHHSRPNEIDSDPDIDIPWIAFTPGDAQERRGLLRFMTKYQAFYFFPLLMLVAIDLQRSSIQFLREGKVKYPKTEAVLLVLHYIGYFGLIFAVLPFWQGLLFIAVHKAANGLYLGSVFAPNHKGMLITEHGSKIDFLSRQVLTARNVKANFLTDYWYGGLNFQIEHHLFPAMPRRHLAKAQRIIRTYCQEHQISYHETSFMRSYREILSYLHEIGAPLRAQMA
jgi:fatty acid desaturase